MWSLMITAWLEGLSNSLSRAGALNFCLLGISLHLVHMVASCLLIMLALSLSGASSIGLAGSQCLTLHPGSLCLE